MPEIGTSSSMSEDGKRSDGLRPPAAAPVLDSTISEVSTRLVEVRKVGYSGLDLLMLSSSHFDPTKTRTQVMADVDRTRWKCCTNGSSRFSLPRRN
jgi:hypothetical protein